MRNLDISLSNKKSMREEITDVEAKDVSELTTEYVDSMSHVHDPSSSSVKNGKSRDDQVCKSFAANKNSSLGENKLITAEAKQMGDEKLGDILALDKGLNNEKDEKSTVDELESEKVNVNIPEAKQDSSQDQAKPRQEYRPVVPKFGEWNVNYPPSAEEFKFKVKVNKVRSEKICGVRGDLSDDFHKIKTFDLKEVTSGEGKKSI